MVQTLWGGLIAWYLFLAGAGAGAYLLSNILSLYNKDEDGQLERIGAFWGPVLVAIGCLFLLADLGHPLRFLYAFLRPFESMISVGTIILSGFIAIGLYHMFCLFVQKKSPANLVKWIGLILAFGTAIYTGLLLGVVKGIAFWNTSLLPVLFVLSALSAGAGLCLVALALSKKKAGSQIHSLTGIDVVILLAEAVALFSLLFISLQSGNATAAGAQVLLNGNFAMIFWMMVVLVGIVVPLVLEVNLERKHTKYPTHNLAQAETAATLQQSSNKVYVLIGLCLLVGSLALRYSVLAAGVKTPLGL